jgi:hypothetical protein
VEQVRDPTRPTDRSAAQKHYVLERVEEEVRRLYAHVPKTIRLKETELEAEQRRLANFVDFIGEGRGRQALAKALEETERRVEALGEELAGLRRRGDNVFQSPPVEWIEERLEHLQEVLGRRTGRSAMVLRTLLGKIRMEPTQGDIGRPYYVAKTSIDVLAILDDRNAKNRRDGGSNSSRWWTRSRRIRTAGARSYRWVTNSSGCSTSIPYPSSNSSGKPLMLYVTMTPACDRIAAARMCRSYSGHPLSFQGSKIRTVSGFGSSRGSMTAPAGKTILTGRPC